MVHNLKSKYLRRTPEIGPGSASVFDIVDVLKSCSTSQMFADDTFIYVCAGISDWGITVFY